LPGGVEHIEKRNLIVDDALLPVRICGHASMSAKNQREEMLVARTFDSRVVFVYKVALDELDGKSGLSDT
jgi:hypothetical protein